MEVRSENARLETNDGRIVTLSSNQFPMISEIRGSGNGKCYSVNTIIHRILQSCEYDICPSSTTGSAMHPATNVKYTACQVGLWTAI